MKRALELPAAPPQESHRDRDVTVTDADLMQVLGLEKSRFYLLKRDGRFRFLELTPQVDGMATRYSPTLLRRWLDGDPLRTPPIRFFTQPKHRAQRTHPGRPRTVRCADPLPDGGE